jgi:hypothetical protein
MQASDEISDALKEAAKSHRDFARLCSITRYGDRFTFSLLDSFRTRWSERTPEERIEAKFVFVLGWLCHRAAD